MLIVQVLGRAIYLQNAVGSSVGSRNNNVNRGNDPMFWIKPGKFQVVRLLKIADNDGLPRDVRTALWGTFVRL